MTTDAKLAALFAFLLGMLAFILFDVAVDIHHHAHPGAGKKWDCKGNGHATIRHEEGPKHHRYGAICIARDK